MTPPTGPRLVIEGGEVLLPDGATRMADVVCEGSRIAAVSGRSAHGGATIDARGALVLPGIVDIHGDAFERALMPRPGVLLDVATAIADTRGQLLAAGITTALVSATDGWEPGLRSRAVLRDLVAHLGTEDAARCAPRLALHIRHERCNTDGIDELIGWIAAGRVAMVSYNDHTPGGIVGVRGLSETQVQRSGLDRESLEERMTAAIERREIGWEQERRIAAAAAEAGTATASHDADDDTDLARDLGLGVTIAEFPTSVSLARRYREHGVSVLLGAPNLVRGRSHLANLSVRAGWEASVVDLLCSDYHYPSLLQAPFVLTSLGAPLHDAWHVVSRGPALAVGFDDRGTIEPAALADVVVVEPAEDGRPARIRAAVVDGRLAFLAP